MKVTEHLAQAKNPLFSYEIIPPRRGKSAAEIIQIVEALLPLQPPYIDVTSHSAEAILLEQPDGSYHKKFSRKRPGTISICGIIQNRFGIDTVAHLLCNGFTREETEDALIELNFLGIQNILAIRGDNMAGEKKDCRNRPVNQYASELVEQIHGLKHGHYLDEISDSEPIDMCIGVAGYPEKHFEATNLTSDVVHLKQKALFGADYIVTQMFFDNKKYFEYLALLKEIGIDIPVIPGIKILTHPRQLQSIPRSFHVDIPENLALEIAENPQHTKEIGIRWTQRQVGELLESGVKNIHFYIMNDTENVSKLVRSFI